MYSLLSYAIHYDGSMHDESITRHSGDLEDRIVERIKKYQTHVVLLAYS